MILLSSLSQFPITLRIYTELWGDRTIDSKKLLSISAAATRRGRASSCATVVIRWEKRFTVIKENATTTVPTMWTSWLERLLTLTSKEDSYFSQVGLKYQSLSKTIKEGFTELSNLERMVNISPRSSYTLIIKKPCPKTTRRYTLSLDWTHLSPMMGPSNGYL